MLKKTAEVFENELSTDDNYGISTGLFRIRISKKSIEAFDIIQDTIYTNLF